MLKIPQMACIPVKCESVICFRLLRRFPLEFMPAVQRILRFGRYLPIWKLWIVNGLPMMGRHRMERINYLLNWETKDTRRC